ncbi:MULTISPECIES: hypothetical protein [Pectobacterium]|uniref:hypothetical protein n=1 Tax=Pectobacterium TaxID=122277 RepID=UPI000E270DAE|nr:MULTISPECIES: hypothetical protein [Pectobacterium]MBN7767335.1 hypothetical protein [Pectobacterium brasiliense]RRO04482.1 hypothetical protein DMB83_002980 [Pectobacterium aquaticum]
MSQSDYLLVGGESDGEIARFSNKKTGECFDVITTNDYTSNIRKESYTVVDYQLINHPAYLVAVCGDVSEEKIKNAVKIAFG